MAVAILKPFLRINRHPVFRCPICGYHTEKLYKKDGLPGLKGMCPNLCHWILPGILGIDNSRVRTMYRVKAVAALSLLRLPS